MTGSFPLQGSAHHQAYSRKILKTYQNNDLNVEFRIVTLWNNEKTPLGDNQKQVNLSVLTS